MVEEILQRDLGAGGFLAQGLGFLAALLGQVARGLFVLHDAEFQARFRHAVQAEDLHRHRRAGFLEAFALLVDERAHAAVILAADDDVADAQRAFAHQHRGGRAAGLEAGFDDVALGAAVRDWP